MDPARAPDAWRGRLGIVPQSGDLFPNLTVIEHLRLFAAYYERPLAVDDVVRMVGLEEKRDARYRTLSGGQRRRLDLGVALVGDPDLVFLDEPTTGFDPAARRAAWETIRSLRDLGKTILLDHALHRGGAPARRPRRRALAGRDRRVRARPPT